MIPVSDQMRLVIIVYWMQIAFMPLIWLRHNLAQMMSHFHINSCQKHIRKKKVNRKSEKALGDCITQWNMMLCEPSHVTEWCVFIKAKIYTFKTWFINNDKNSLHLGCSVRFLIYLVQFFSFIQCSFESITNREWVNEWNWVYTPSARQHSAMYYINIYNITMLV